MRDYHIYTYKAIWAAAVREELVCERLPHIHLQGYMGCSSIERSCCSSYREELVCVRLTHIHLQGYMGCSS